MQDFVAVILAGGSGERFWPLSRKNKPKQFLTLEDGGMSLIQATAERLMQLCGSYEKIFVVTSTEYRSQVLEQLPDLPSENLIVEPVARDTAPAVLYAALTVKKFYPNAVMGVFPSDHRITEPQAFVEVMQAAIVVAASEQAIVTLGITPSYPATGYGYIQRGTFLIEVSGLAAYQVNCFTEKPDLATAEAFIDSGLYSWNSGMFVWHVDTVLAEYAQYQPQMHQILTEAMQERGKIKDIFPFIEKISVDYAILEKSKRVVVIPAEFGWDDLGDWNALERLLQRQGQNVSVGKHLGLDTEGAIMYTTNGDDLIVTIGLEDVVIVRTQEVTLVVRKDRTQDIKKIVQKLKMTPELARFA